MSIASIAPVPLPRPPGPPPPPPPLKVPEGPAQPPPPLKVPEGPAQPPPKKSIKQRLKEDLLLFGKVAVPEMFKEASAKCHREWANLLLDKTIQKLLLMAPRKHAKSSIVACLKVLHHIMFDDGPKVVVLVSKTGGHARRLLGTIKIVLDTGRSFRRIFGYWGKHSAIRWAEDQVILKDGTLILALGTGQQAVGLKEGHQRPTLIILDDPEDMENTKTEKALRYNIRWLLKSLVPTLDTKRGQIVVVGTPQCDGCMILKLLELPGWTAKHYKGILNYKKKIVLWPEGCSYEFMMGEKADAEAAGELNVWYSEYMCEIVPDEEQLFKPKYNRYYRGYIIPDKDPAKGGRGEAYVHITHKADKKKDLEDDSKSKLASPEIIPVHIFMGCDPASSESKRADHSVNFPIAIDKDWNIYCLPYFHKRVPPTEHAQSIVEMYEELYPIKTTPEATGYQEALRDILRKFSQLWSKSKQRIYIPGLEAKVLPKEKKTKRHKTALHIHFFRRKVWLTDDMEDFESELAKWREDKTLIDDLIDGFYLAMLKAYPPTHLYTGEKSSTNRVRRNRNAESYLDA